MTELGAVVLVLVVGMLIGMLLSRPAPLPPIEVPDAIPYHPSLHRPAGALVLPVRVLLEFCNPATVARHRLYDAEKLDALEEQLRADGQKEPVILKIDTKNRAVVKDGYHRLIVLDRIGTYNALVDVEVAGSSCGWGRPLSLLFRPHIAAALGWYAR